MLITDITAKITIYSEASGILTAAGFCLLALAVWMFFHFHILRIFDRISGRGEKRERERFRNYQSKHTGYTGDVSSDTDHDSMTPGMGLDPDSGDLASEEIKAGNDGEPDMSVWDDTGALKEMFDNRLSGKSTSKVVESPVRSNDLSHEKPKEDITAPLRKGPSSEFAETGLLAIKEEQKARAHTKQMEERAAEDGETGLLKQPPGEMPKKTEPATGTFRIISHIAETSKGGAFHEKE